MTRIRIAFAALTLVLIGLFVASVATTINFSDQHGLGVAFTQVTGIVSIGWMSAAMVLAIRPKWLEPGLDGLDKMYRLHKWLGVAGMLIGVVHWLTKTGDGGGRHGARAAQPVADAAATTAASAESWWQGLVGPAHGVAQPVLFVLIALAAVALIKAIPYRWFAKTHILTVAMFAVLAFHSIVLLKAAYWATPIAWLTAALTAAGVVAGVVALVRFGGGARRAQAKVVSATYYPELRVLETDLTMQPGWPGHRPGQFAFVTTDRREGAHPFTIATAWDPATRRIGFIAKELGDHTKRLRETFTEGRPAAVEGPYGCFTFDDARPRQIWIGAGIGITPFVAKMRERGASPEGKAIDLFHSTTEESEAALARMRADAAAARVTLHILISPRDGRLDGAQIRAAVPDWAAASVWFCGPGPFGAALRTDFIAHGLRRSDFHQELFEMR